MYWIYLDPLVPINDPLQRENDEKKRRSPLLYDVGHLFSDTDIMHTHTTTHVNALNIEPGNICTTTY